MLAVRVRLHGNTDVAKSLLPTGRGFLNHLTNDMKFNSLAQNQRTVKMANGVIFTVKRVFGQDTIDVTVPIVEVQGKKIEEEIVATPKYRIKLFNFPISEEAVLTTACLMRMTFYHRDATDVEDTSKIVFDYKVPDDTDEDGKLITTPEEYFGSEDNPGLEWDDDNECFMVDTMQFTKPYLGNALGYAVALGAEELKHFVTYSCMHCPEEETEKYYAARQDQQYEDIIKDEERWKEDNLIEPSFGTGEDDILEDKIACVIGFSIMAKLGNWRVIWEAVTQKYAEHIINDDGDEILGSDWPVHKDSLDDWIAATENKGSTINNDWGALCIIDTLEDCPAYGGYDYDYYCEKADHYTPECMQYKSAYKNSDPDPPLTETVTEEGFEYRCSDTYPYYAYTFRSQYGSINDFGILIGCETQTDSYQFSSTSGGNHIQLSINVVVRTPWGVLFGEGIKVREKDCGSMGTNLWWQSDDRYGVPQAYERHIVTHYKSTNIMFFITGGFYDLVKLNLTAPPSCNPTTPWTVLDTKYGVDAIGVIGFFNEEECNSMDINDMTEAEDIRSGFKNLMQAYFDDVGDGTPELIEPDFDHREGVM